MTNLRSTILSKPSKGSSRIKSRRSWAQCVDDRLTWLMAVSWVPPRVWQVMVVLIQHADTDGFSQVGSKVLQNSTNLRKADVLAAFAEAVDMGLLALESTQRGQPRWLILEGGEPSDASPLVKDYILEEIRALKGLTSREILVLEAMVDIGFCHSDQRLRITHPLLEARIPSVRGSGLVDVLCRLRQKGYLIKEERGYGVKKPAVYRLALPISPEHGQQPVPFPVR